MRTAASPTQLWKPVSLLLLLLLLAAPASAAESFYKDKELNILVGFSAGSGPDLHARLVARHLSRFIPGSPSMIIRNNPGASGILAFNYVYNRAKKDGLTVATTTSGLITRQLIKRPGIRFDLKKSVLIGANSPQSRYMYVNGGLGIKSLGDLYKREKPIVTGWSSKGGGPDVLIELMFRMLGLKRNAIYGYKGGPDIFLAVQRGEIEMASSNEMTYPTQGKQLEADGAIRTLVQSGIYKDGRFARSQTLADIPTVEEAYTKRAGKAPSGPYWDAFKALSAVPTRSYWVAPGTPADRIATLRKAFDQMREDPAYQADSKKLLGYVDDVGTGPRKQIIVNYLSLPDDIAKLFAR